MQRPVVVDGVEIEVAFTSPAVFEIELRTIFARSWVHVTDLADVPDRGSYVTAPVGRSPVIILRERHSGELRGSW